MANPYAGVREAIISTGCYARLDTMRAFRHRERNSYGTHLDVHLVIDRSREVADGFNLLRSEVMAFLAKHGSDRQDGEPSDC